MSKIATAIIAAVAIAFTAPAMAASQGSKLNAKVIQKNGKTLYCVKQTTTGSRMPSNTCLTKEEWEQTGSVIAAAKSDAVLASNVQTANQN